MQVYRLMMPTRTEEVGEHLLNAAFYGTGIYLATLVTAGLAKSIGLFVPVQILVAALTILMLSLVLPIIVVCLIRGKWLKRLQIPYPTAWDFFFDQRKCVFLLFHLRNGKKIGGYFGERSYAGAFPNDGDVYVELVYETESTGRMKQCVEGSGGMLISSDAYDYVEILNVPPTSNTKGLSDGT